MTTSWAYETLEAYLEHQAHDSGWGDFIHCDWKALQLMFYRVLQMLILQGLTYFDRDMSNSYITQKNNFKFRMHKLLVDRNDSTVIANSAL